MSSLAPCHIINWFDYYKGTANKKASKGTPLIISHGNLALNIRLQPFRKLCLWHAADAGVDDFAALKQH